jgi:hypothetical protein
MAHHYKSFIALAATMLTWNSSFAVQEGVSSAAGGKEAQRQGVAKKSSNSTVETKTIYRQVMKDGSVVFSDVGAQGAVKTAAIPYQTTSSPSALLLANQQKDHWKRQAEGFNQRQAQRDSEFEQARRERLYSQQLAYARDSGWYGPAPRVIYGAAGHPLRGNFPQQGVSGVGAAHNVPSSFIGSGFATASPLSPSFGGSRR